MMKHAIEFSESEIKLLLEALRRSAGRHESEARYNPRNAKPHIDAASKMMNLHHRIAQKT